MHKHVIQRCGLSWIAVVLTFMIGWSVLPAPVWADVQNADAQVISYHQEVLIEEINLYVGNDTNTYNAGVAAEIIDGYVLNPGDIFSFNTVVGMRTSDKGFIRGIMYVTVDGERATKEVMGSGVCRISTALFQAANDVGFDILERHNHAYESTYAELGNDAAVMYGILDNQFRNNCEFPIRIRCRLEDRRVIVVQFYRLPA